MVIDDLSSDDHSVIQLDAESSIELIAPDSTAIPIKKLVNDFAVTVIMASGGYPEDYKTGFIIEGINELNNLKSSEIFHSGTKYMNNSLVTNGGRVLSITSRSSTLFKARKKAYEIVNKIKWKDEYHRSDIAKKNLIP